MSRDAATAMNEMYLYQRHIYDLTRKPYLLGRDRLLATLAPGTGDSVLEIGCGTGRNLVRAAQMYPGATFYGVDVSNVMLETARTSVARTGLASRIRVAQADATDFDAGSLFGRAQFERVFISYALSMIPGWQAALRCALAQLAPNGTLHIVDFGDGAHLPRWFHALLLTWLGLFHVTPRVDLHDAVAVCAGPDGRPFELKPLYGGYAVAATIGAVADVTRVQRESCLTR